MPACSANPLTGWVQRVRIEGQARSIPAQAARRLRGRTMIRLDARKPVHFCDGLTRRDFLHAGSLSALGLGLPALQAIARAGSAAPETDVNCILLFLVGGPS